MSTNFIMVFHKMFKGEGKLTPQQLFIYSFLYRRRLPFNNSWIANITVNDIHTLISCKLDGKRDRNKSIIVEELLVLRDKKYIYIDGVYDSITHNQILSITFKERKVNDDEDNFVKIYYDSFDKFSDRNKFWLYCFVSRHGEWGISISHKQLSDLSRIPISTLRNCVIKELNSSSSIPRIYKFSGSYVLGNSPRQEENKYYSDLFITAECIAEYNRFYKENGEARFKKVVSTRSDDEWVWTFEGGLTVEEIRGYISHTNWGKRNIYDNDWNDLEYEDYYWYRVSLDENIELRFNQRCKATMEKLKKLPEKYKYNWVEWEETYLNNQLEALKNKEYYLKLEEEGVLDQN